MRIVLALPPLEVHSRGVLAVARFLRGDGHEVVYIANASPEALAKAAIDEDADLVGFSAYCGGEAHFGSRLFAELGGTTRPTRPVLMAGGLLSRAGMAALEELGFTCWPSGTSLSALAGWLDSLAEPGV